MSIIDPNSPGLFSFFAPKAGGPSSYQGMEARRRIALQLLANSRKGYPKNIGEGLTAIGDALGDRAVLNQLAQQESAYQKQATEAAAGAIPAEARTSEPPSAVPPETRPPGPQSALPPIAMQPPLATAELTPDERAAGVVGGEANALDAAAPVVAAATPGYRAAPPYLRAALEQNISDPERRGYLGHLAGKEAQSASEVSSTGASGPFQFTRGTGRQYGLVGPGGDRRNDIAASILAVNKFTDDNVATLTARLGRPPTPGEMALAHQQGAVTAARMLSGAGNASASNLAVNNVNPGASPQAAAAKIMAYYGMPGGGGAPQAAQMTPPAQPITAADAAGIDRLGDVTGLGTGDRGYSYPPTASLGRQGDVQSDAPSLTGISPNVGAAAADTIQQRRDAIARARLPGMMPPPLGPIGPTGPTAMAPPAANVVSDIAPAPPGAGTQFAQAAPPGGLPPVQAPLTGLPQRAVPPPVATEPPSSREALPAPSPMGADEKRGYQIRAQERALGIPLEMQQGQGLIDLGVRDRQQRDAALMQDYRDRLLARRTKELADEAFNRAAPERELTRQQAEVALAKAKQFGGLSEGAVLKPVEDSAKAVAGIPQGQTAVRNALRVLPETFTGATADVHLATQKLLAAAGFRVDPGIPATEQFKAFIMPALAAARQAQSGGANISDNDMALAAKAVAGDIKLDKTSIQGILEELQRVNVKAAIWHQSKVEAAAGDDPQRQAFMLRSYGLPMQDLVDPGAIQLLRAHPTADVIEQFNRKYHTPGLAQQLLGGR